MEIRTYTDPTKEQQAYQHFPQTSLKKAITGELSTIAQQSERATAPSCCSRMIATISGLITRFISWLKGLCSKDDRPNSPTEEKKAADVEQLPLTFIIETIEGTCTTMICPKEPDEAREVGLVHCAFGRMPPDNSKHLPYLQIVTKNQWTPSESHQIVSKIKEMMNQWGLTHLNYRDVDCTIDGTLFLSAGFIKEKAFDHDRNISGYAPNLLKLGDNHL